MTLEITNQINKAKELKTWFNGQWLQSSVTIYFEYGNLYSQLQYLISKSAETGEIESVQFI